MTGTKLFAFGFLIVTIPFTVAGQETEQNAVMNTVQELFVAMETNDSSLAASLFTKDARLITIFQNGSEINQLRSSPASRLASAFSSPKEQIWHEPIWNEKVEISDGLASVWVDYAFFIGNQFSHCGVDAFHLVKIGNKWKIFHLADTRRKDDCNIPEHILNKYEK